MNSDAPDWEFRRRDVCILKELSRDPQLSSRKLADRLEENYGIDDPHTLFYSLPTGTYQ